MPIPPQVLIPQSPGLQGRGQSGGRGTIRRYGCGGGGERISRGGGGGGGGGGDRRGNRGRTWKSLCRGRREWGGRCRKCRIGHHLGPACDGRAKNAQMIQCS